MPAASEDPADPPRDAEGSGRDGEVGPGSAPHTPPPHTPPAGGERRDEGTPRGGARRTVPFATNVRPSPVAARTRPGRARRHHIDHEEPPGSGGRPAGRRPAPGKGRRTTQRRRERLTRTARSQRGGVVAAAPGARSGERTGAGWPSPPSPPPPGGSETRTRAGTGSRDTPGRARGQQARGPQQAAQAGARPASRVTGRPEPRTHPESQPLQRQVARGQRVSNNPVAQDADSE